MKRSAETTSAFEVSRAFDARQREFVVVISSDFFEDLILRAPVIKIGVISVAGFQAGARVGNADAHKSSWIMERKRAQQFGIYHRENRRVRADSEGEREHRNGGETGVLREHAHAVANIL